MDCSLAGFHNIDETITVNNFCINGEPRSKDGSVGMGKRLIALNKNVPTSIGNVRLCVLVRGSSIKSASSTERT